MYFVYFFTIFLVLMTNFFSMPPMLIYTICKRLKHKVFSNYRKRYKL